MRTHTLHCGRHAQVRRGRGYTLLEVVVAMLVLMTSVTAITVAVVDVQVGAANARLKQAVLDATNTTSVLLASEDFDSLVGGSFDPPNACTFPGVADPMSCLEVAGSTHVVTWQVQFEGDAPDSAVLVGTVPVASDTLTVTQVVARP